MADRKIMFGAETVSDVRGVPQADDFGSYTFQAYSFLQSAKALFAAGPEHLHAGMLLAAISTELSLKGYLRLKTGGASWTHDLRQLFGSAKAAGLRLVLTPEEEATLDQISVWYAGESNQKGKGKYRPCVYPIARHAMCLHPHVRPMFDRIAAACQGTGDERLAWAKREDARRASPRAQNP